MTLLPSLLCACSTFRTHNSQFCQVNWLSVCFANVALNTRDLQPARCCSSHVKYRCDFDTRVPGDRRTSLHADTLVLRTDSSSRVTEPPPACLLLVRWVPQPNSQHFAKGQFRLLSVCHLRSRLVSSRSTILPSLPRSAQFSEAFTTVCLPHSLCFGAVKCSSKISLEPIPSPGIHRDLFVYSV